MRKGVAVIAMAVALAGCGATEGTVTEKEHEPARTWTETVQTYGDSCTGTGTKRKCVRVYKGPRVEIRHSAECWELDLSDGSEVCVSRQVWESVKVGDFYSE